MTSIKISAKELLDYVNTYPELYITNFKTPSTAAEYVVEIYRYYGTNKQFLVGSFGFKTVK